MRRKRKAKENHKNYEDTKMTNSGKVHKERTNSDDLKDTNKMIKKI